ncbi:protein A16-like [Anopheles maculipalpis]|uniref:protein A16-like n=1 Tax=Anopheles maculipalpis TaxID=1496333 RepID=UPI00215978FF|nr:protein A16-like [Anopheles maculipalpis]
MFPAKENLALVLLLATFVTLSLALPTANDKLLNPKGSVAKLNTPIDGAEIRPIERAGRILLPTDFAVKKKKYSIGMQGVGTFFNAWRNCISEGKGLATIESEEEQKFLESMLDSISPQTRYWIGATNLGATDFSLTWITTDLPVETTPFFLDLTAPTCISLDSSGTWYKNDCYSPQSTLPYICEEYY